MTYPPQHPHAYPPPSADRRPGWRKGLKWVLIVLPAVITVWGLIAFLFRVSGAPETGECLVDLTKEWDGWDTVGCEDPSAAYKVVDTDFYGQGTKNDLGTCDGHPNGRQINGTTGGRGGTASTSTWEMCVVPLD